MGRQIAGRAQAGPGEAIKMLRFLDALGIGELPLPPRARVRSRAHKERQLRDLTLEIGKCRRCALCKERKNVVFGEGDPGAKLMFVGEGPGRDEDLAARPFVGEAGRLLRNLISKMGFKDGQVYIANMVKCRPPGNRDPEPEEMEACSGFIHRQIEIISPEVIMALGRIASHALTGKTTPISRLRGNLYELGGAFLMPTFHPAYLLRNRAEKAKAWEDAQKVLGLLGRQPK